MKPKTSYCQQQSSQYPIFPSRALDQSFTRVAPSETKYQKILDAADFARRENCSFIRLNDALGKTLLKAAKKTPRQPTMQHLQHKHCQHKLFNGGRLDWRTSECRHLSLTRTPMKLVVDGRSGKTSCSLDSDIFVSRALRIVSTLFTFTEENKYGNWSNHLKTFLHRHPPRV